MFSSTSLLPFLVKEHTLFLLMKHCCLASASPVCFSRSIFFILEPVINGDISTSWPLKWGTQSFSVMEMLPWMNVSLNAFMKELFSGLLQGIFNWQEGVWVACERSAVFLPPSVSEVSPCIQSSPLPEFVNQALWEHSHARFFMCCLGMLLDCSGRVK